MFTDTQRIDWLEHIAMELEVVIRTGPDGFELHIGRVTFNGKGQSDLRRLIDEVLKGDV